MAQKYPGLYLYFDWLRVLEKMPPGIAMQIITNLHHFTEEGRELQPLKKPQYEMVQEVFVDQIKRAKIRSETNQRNAQCRYQKTAEYFPEGRLTDQEDLRSAMRTNPVYADDDHEEILVLRNAIQRAKERMKAVDERTGRGEE